MSYEVLILVMNLVYILFSVLSGWTWSEQISMNFEHINSAPIFFDTTTRVLKVN